MTQEEATTRMLSELIIRKLIQPDNALIMKQYLEQMYSIGWNNFRDTFVNLRKKPVVQLNSHGDIVGEYDSLTMAYEETGINIKNISRASLGQRKTAGGYYWKLKN